MKKNFILNVALRGNKKNAVLSLDCNDQGVPWDSYWSRRFHDSKVDGCISAVIVAKESKQSKEVI